MERNVDEESSANSKPWSEAPAEAIPLPEKHTLAPQERRPTVQIRIDIWSHN
jgi:hypothetical protein